MIDYSRRSRRKRVKSPSKIFKVNKITKYIFLGLIGLIFFVVILFVWYSRDLPTPGKLSEGNLPQSTRIMDKNEIVLYDIYDQQNRSYVELSKVPKYLKEGTIAIEDKDFYSNRGYSIAGYARSILSAITFRGITGGSTLTQQLVRNTLISAERTIPRKIKEFILAVEVDRKYTKDEILELYLNNVPYGGTNVGVEVAAENYFGKKVEDLDLVECAILAGLPQRPSYFYPYGFHPKAYIGRTEDVLRRMREDGYITDKEEKDALSKLPKVKFLPKSHSIKAPHFSFYVKNLLVEKFGEETVENGGLQVITSLDYKLQEKAEEIVEDEVLAARNLKVGNGASVVIDPKNGHILSLVGSRDFFATESAINSKESVAFEGQFNVITQGLRQPGSSIKPITYATSLDRGYTAASLIMDTKTVFPNQGGKDYIPVNYDGKYHGPVQSRFALGSSLNIPAVKMLAWVGIKNMLQTAYNMGISTLEPTSSNVSKFGLSITLGGGEVVPLELASAYSAFANGGYKVEPVAILKVTDKKGKVLFEHKETSSKKQVIKPEVAFIISHILLDNNARLITFGENSYLNIRTREIAVKTGTTDDKRDNWAVGWTPNVLVLSWVGNNDNSEMGAVASGVTGATPIWRKIILEAIKDLPNEEFVKPDNVIALTIDALGGGLPVDGQATRTEYFIKGTEPQSYASIYQDVKVSKEDNGNKLASDSEIERNDYDTKKFIVFEEKDPISTDGRNRWQDGINEWLKDNYKDNSLYHPPTEKSSREGNEKKKDDEEPTVTPELTPTP